MIKKVRPGWIWIFVFGGILVLHLWSLARYPAPLVDEMWLISRAEGFIQTGHPFGMLDDGKIANMPGIWATNQWLITALQAAVLRFFPQPELIPVRILAFVFGLILLGAGYWTAWRLGGKRLALTSTLLLSLSPAFFYSGHEARYDILAAALSYLALALVINNRRGRFWLGALAGLALGLGIETHLNGLIFVPVVGVYFLVEYGKSFIRRAACWGFAFGLGLGLAFYLALHVLPYPQTYSQSALLLFGETQRPPLLTGDILAIVKNIGYTARILFGGMATLVLLVALALPILVKDKSKEKRHILFLNVALFISTTLIMPNKSGWYAILLVPAFIWMASYGLLYFASKPWRRSIGQYLRTVALLVCVVGMIGISLSFLVHDGFRGYQEMQAKVNSVIKPGEVIMGSQIYWLGLYDHPFYSWESLFIYPRFAPGSSLAETFAHYQPDIFLMDSTMEITFFDNLDPSSRQYYLSLPREELFDYLDKNSVKVFEEYSNTYGWVRVYRMTGVR